MDEVDLDLRETEILALIGPTAPERSPSPMLTGRQRLAAGGIELAGREIARWATAEIARAGLVRTFQEGRPFARLTSFTNVEVAALALGASRRRAQVVARTLLAQLRLDHRAEQPAYRLTTGRSAGCRWREHSQRILWL